MDPMKHINLIRSVAWKFHRETGLTYEDLFSEAVLGCYQYQASKKFDPTKGNKESTYLYFCAKNALINYCKREKRLEMRHVPIDDIEISIEPGDDFMDVIHEWPEDCQEVAKMIIGDAEYFIGETPNFKRTKGEHTTARQRLIATLRSEGWKVVRIQETMKNIKTLLSETT